MRPSMSDRTSTALQLEELMLRRAMEEIGEWSRCAEEEATRDCAARGFLQSGVFARKLAAIHQERAKRMVDKRIALRRETLKQAPELATEKNFGSLLESACLTIDDVFKSIPHHMSRQGIQASPGDVQQKYEIEIGTLKRYAKREIEILKREAELRLASAEAEGKRRGWLGRNLDGANQILIALFTSMLATASILAGLNHKVLPYVLIFLSALTFFLILGRALRQRPVAKETEGITLDE
jgi:hypothetical protein